MAVYNAKERTITTRDGRRYWFYTGDVALDKAGVFIAQLLERGYVTEDEKDIIVLYIDLLQVKSNEVEVCHYPTKKKGVITRLRERFQRLTKQ